MISLGECRTICHNARFRLAKCGGTNSSLAGSGNVRKFRMSEERAGEQVEALVQELLLKVDEL